MLAMHGGLWGRLTGKTEAALLIAAQTSLPVVPTANAIESHQNATE